MPTVYRIETPRNQQRIVVGQTMVWPILAQRRPSRFAGAEVYCGVKRGTEAKCGGGSPVVHVPGTRTGTRAHPRQPKPCLQFSLSVVEHPKLSDRETNQAFPMDSPTENLLVSLL